MPPACCAPVQEALPLLRRDRRWQMYDREPIPSWVDGCLALLSDAAHPMRQYLAQGSCQSMQDGVALPNALTGAADVPTGLAGYADARRDRAARVQATARVWGELACRRGARLLRNELLRSLPAGHVRYVDWLYGPPRD